jgi:hypothetical protein
MIFCQYTEAASMVFPVTGTESGVPSRRRRMMVSTSGSSGMDILSLDDVLNVFLFNLIHLPG